MTSTHPADLGLIEASAELRAGRLTSVELTAACLARIDELDAAFGAWLHVYEDQAGEAARRADERRRAGDATPLTGIPVGLKDVIGVAGRPLTGDSSVLSGNVAAADSTAWARLERAGMVLLGHLHCGELACGSWGSNPWGSSFSPGGSSSGSAIAVATRTVPASLGSDGRGSVRIPASFNGVTGLKPSFGLVSTAGCIPITFTYDVIGPLARQSADCALLMRVLAGPDPADPATLAQPLHLPFPQDPRPGPTPLAGSRIGVLVSPGEPMAVGVAAVFSRFQEELATLGATLVPIKRLADPLEELDGAGAGWKTILGAEALAIHDQFSGREHLHRAEFLELFEPMVERTGTALEYVQAQIKRAELGAAWRALFAEHELTAVIEPGLAEEMWRLDQPMTREDHPLHVSRHPFSFGMWSDANFPVLSVPAGVSASDGAPVGMQIIGLPWTDPTLLQIGIDYQAATGYHLVDPPRLAGAALKPYVPPDVPAAAGPQPAFVTQPSPLGAVMFAESGQSPPRAAFGATR